MRHFIDTDTDGFYVAVQDVDGTISTLSGDAPMTYAETLDCIGQLVDYCGLSSDIAEDLHAELSDVGAL